MTNKSQFDRVLTYITDHPGSSCAEISASTCVARSIVAGLLTQMNRNKLVIRQKVDHLYRYRAVRKKAEPSPPPINLNAMFNSLLRSARENRA